MTTEWTEVIPFQGGGDETSAIVGLAVVGFAVVGNATGGVENQWTEVEPT